MSNEEQQKEMLNGLSTLYGQFARLIHEADELDMWNVESENFKFPKDIFQLRLKNLFTKKYLEML